MRLDALQTSPLLHFALLGSLLFGAIEVLPRGGPRNHPEGDRPRIRLEAAAIDRLVEQFEQRHREAATPSVRRALIRSWVEQELLFREALRLGLDRGDSSVSRRLLEKYRPLATDPAKPDADLIDEARALGWVENDVVIRRILVERMSRLLRHDPDGVVSQEEIDAAIATRGRAPADPPTLDFEHLYLGSERPEAPSDSESPAAARPIQAIESQSQAFPLGLAFQAQSQLRVASRFGAEFAAHLFAAPIGAWRGPVASTYGWHFVRVTRVREAAPHPEQETRTWAIRTVSRKHAEERLRRHLDQLSRNYAIEVEDPLWRGEAASARGARNS